MSGSYLTQENINGSAVLKALRITALHRLRPRSVSLGARFILGLPGFQREHWMDRIQHVRLSSDRRSETAGDLECLKTFHKFNLLKMKFVIEKKRGATRFWGDVKS